MVALAASATARMRWEMLPDGACTKRKETRDLMELCAHLGTQDALIRYHEGKI